MQSCRDLHSNQGASLQQLTLDQSIGSLKNEVTGTRAPAAADLSIAMMRGCFLWSHDLFCILCRQSIGGWHGVDQSLLHQASQKRPAVCCLRLHMQTEPQQARDCAPCWLQGLGKTAQSIATLAFQAQFLGMLGPHIVIAPLTTLGHWKREIQTWTDMVQLPPCCVRLTLSKALRGELSQYHGSLAWHNSLKSCTS